ncbi:MAG: hypothetical protein CBD74_02100 [Saprospirales bacterium TMED214]|nr:MAG: hypothetical protein CBD74_02100 [Saprospirales bacterium TMED214]
MIKHITFPFRFSFTVMLYLCCGLLFGQVESVAHRGASLSAPENTLASTVKAIELGVDRIEMDVRQSKDGVLVLMHDARLERTTNGKGYLRDFTYEELLSLDAGSWFSKAYSGERIPTLALILGLLANTPNTAPDLDIKECDPIRLVDVIGASGILEKHRVTLHCSDEALRQSIQRQIDLLQLDSLVIRQGPFATKKAAYSALLANQSTIINVPFRQLTKRYVDAIHSKGGAVFLDCLDRQDASRCYRKGIELGIDYIQADQLGPLLIHLIEPEVIALEDLTAFDLQGHRGCRGLYPENSLQAMIHAVDLGVTTLEMDVVITRDGKVVLSHEHWLNATICLDPEGNPISKADEKTWNIYAMTYDSLSRCDCGSLPHPQFSQQIKKEAVKPKLRDIIQEVEAYTKEHGKASVKYSIEIKTRRSGDNIYHPIPSEFIDEVYSVLDQMLDSNAMRRVSIQSYNHRVLRALRKGQLEGKYSKDLSIVLLDGENGNLREIIAELGFVPDIYSPRYNLVYSSRIEDAHAAGVLVIPYTVNEVEDIKRLIEMGVDGIITDYPNRFFE